MAVVGGSHQIFTHPNIGLSLLDPFFPGNPVPPINHLLGQFGIGGKGGIVLLYGRIREGLPGTGSVPMNPDRVGENPFDPFDS
jgi:hypothetical protein